MDFLGILLLTFLCLMALIYMCKHYFRNGEYIVEEEISQEDFEILQAHINNINNVSVNFNPNSRESNHEMPPKYEDIQNEPPSYPPLNSS